MFEQSDFLALFIRKHMAGGTGMTGVDSEIRYQKLKHREIAHLAGGKYYDYIYLDGAYDAEDDRLFFRLCMANDDDDMYMFPASGTETYLYLNENEVTEVLHNGGNTGFDSFSRNDWIDYLTGNR